MLFAAFGKPSTVSNTRPSTSARELAREREKLRFRVKMEMLFPYATCLGLRLNCVSGRATILLCALLLAFWSVQPFSL
jgi:hypothetical protein